MATLICTLCYQEFKKNDEIKVTSCSHKFHCHCFDLSFIVSKQCPNCDEILSASDINRETFGSTKGSEKSTSKNDVYLENQAEILKVLKELKLGRSKQSRSDSDSDDDASPKHRRKSHYRRRRESFDSEGYDYSQGHGSRRQEVEEYRSAEIVNRNGTVIKCNEYKPSTLNLSFSVFGFGGASRNPNPSLEHLN